MQKLEEVLQVFMPTSLAPWHPSTEVTEKAIQSLRSFLKEEIVVNVYCDGLPPWANADDLLNYHTYIAGLHSCSKVRVWESERWIGLAGLVKDFMLHFDKPLMFNMQHDWIITNQETVDGVFQEAPVIRQSSHLGFVLFV